MDEEAESLDWGLRRRAGPGLSVPRGWGWAGFLSLGKRNLVSERKCRWGILLCSQWEPGCSGHRSPSALPGVQEGWLCGCTGLKKIGVSLATGKGMWVGSSQSHARTGARV